MRLDLYAEGGYSGGGITENGGNISGPLLLAGNPSQTLEAVPKQYVDAYYNSISASNLTNGTLHAARLPNFTGDLQSSPGTTQLTLNNSGVTAGEYSKVTVNAKGIVTAGSNISDSDIPFGLNWSKINPGTLPSTLSGYGITNGVSVNGGTMLGFLSISNEPTLGSHIATKQYVDALVSGGGIAVGDILRKPYSTTPIGFLKCNGAEVDKTIYANLYSVIGDQYTDNATIGNGKPWQFQYQINETQNNNITDWATATALPSASGYNCSIATKNRVYLFVGWNGTAYTSIVYTAPINADGTLGSWSATTSLPGVLGGSQAIITKNRVYLLGGYNGSTWVTTTYTAPINSDGTLGTWTTGTSLPSGFSDSQAIVTKNRVYIFGGWNGTSQISNVYTATISSDGFIDNWTSSTPLTLGVSLASVCAIKNKVYIFGGYITGNGSQSTVYSAPINIDGTLGLWSAENSLPVKFSHSQVYVTKNRVYLLGGYNNSAYTTNVYTAPINADGSIGTWVIGSPMSSISSHGSVIATLNNIYYFGGYTGSGWISTVQFAAINGGLNDYSSYYSQDSNNYLMSGSGQPWRQQYQINTSQSNDITGWTSGTALPGGLTYSQAVVTKNRVYLFGGNTASNVWSSTVYTAAINTDGTLGTWSTSNSIPLACSGHSVIVTKNRLYLLGGQTSSNSATSNIYTSVINADGTIGNWVSSGNLPTNLAFFSSFISKNNIYIVGGWNGSATVSTVYRASINTDGTLGGWVTTPSLPAIVNNSQIAVTNNRVYLLGGHNNTSSVSSVYTATINNEGLISNWSVSSNLVTAVHASQIVCTRNKLYLFGGYNTGSGELSTVQTATINSDGTLNAWTTGTSLPVTISSSQAIVVNNRIYLLSNWNNGGVNGVVYTANITGGNNDYSEYYGDLISFAITDNYMMPGSGKPWQQQYQINETQISDITGWSNYGNLPGILSGTEVLVTKNRIYLLGGYNGTATASTVYTAPINTDGTIGSWSVDASLPVSADNSQIFVTKNRVYFAGGNSGTSALSSVYTAPINSDGTLGLWAATTSLPGPLRYSQALVTNKRVYLIGGHDGTSYLSTTYNAPINADGTIGAWVLGTSLPAGLGHIKAIITKNRVYILGGSNAPSTSLSVVYTASISADGVIGDWTTATSLPGILSVTSHIVTKNRVYLIGGHTTGVYTSTVYTAPINADGTLGTWTTGTSLPVPIGHSKAAIVKNKVYLFGGNISGIDSGTIYSANISSDIQDYSPYYDGTIQYLQPIYQYSKFLLPDLSADEPFGSYSYIKY